MSSSDSEESAQIVARCFHCKRNCAIKDAHQVRTPNHRLRVAGSCEECGKAVSRFISDPERPSLTPEEKKAKEEKRRQERKKLIQDGTLKPVEKKAGKKRSIKECKNCQCKSHEQLIQEQPKKKRVSQKEKREKLINELQQQVKNLQEKSQGASSASNSEGEEMVEEESSE